VVGHLRGGGRTPKCRARPARAAALCTRLFGELGPELGIRVAFAWAGSVSPVEVTAFALLVGAQSVWPMPALGETAAERLPDRDVKKIIDQVDEAAGQVRG